MPIRIALTFANNFYLVFYFLNKLENCLRVSNEKPFRFTRSVKRKLQILNAYCYRNEKNRCLRNYVYFVLLCFIRLRNKRIRNKVRLRKSYDKPLVCKLWKIDQYSIQFQTYNMYSFKYKYLVKNTIEREGILIKNHELP